MYGFLRKCIRTIHNIPVHKRRTYVLLLYFKKFLMPYEIGHIKSYTPNSRRFDREPYIATIKAFIGSSEQFAIVYPKKTYKNDIFQRDLARLKTVVKEQDYKNIKIHEHYSEKQQWSIVLENTSYND